MVQRSNVITLLLVALVMSAMHVYNSLRVVVDEGIRWSAERDLPGSGVHRNVTAPGKHKVTNLAVDDVLKEGNANTTTKKLPNVLLIGAQKAGTTALAEWIYKNGVCRPKVGKEVHFFDNDNNYHKQGSEFLIKEFQHCPDGSLRMDATPKTMLYAKRVRQTYDSISSWHATKLKILVVLREPVARELSLYNMMSSLYRSYGRETKGWWTPVARKDGSVMTFAEFFDHVTLRGINSGCKQGSRCRGLYEQYLRQWMDLFDRNQILVLAYDELMHNKESFLGRVKDFLGLNVGQGLQHEISKRKKHESDYMARVLPCSLQANVSKTFEKANRALYDLLEARPGPSMEQQPFPHFVLSNCSMEEIEAPEPVE